MEKRLQQSIVHGVKQCLFPVPWLAGLVAVFSPAAQSSARAQVVPTAGGARTTVTTTGDQYDIAGGTQAGGNLFHEFDEFSVREGQTANFLSDSGVFNIVGQVLEANPSYINGIVQVSGSDANLYLVNPSGVLFGPNAQLSLQGSFTATTADQVAFEGEVLNVLSQNTDYTPLTGNPTGLHFTQESASAVVNQGRLAVAAGESLSLLGGSVVNTGQLEAPEGEVSLVAVRGNSAVKLATPGSLLSMEVNPAELELALVTDRELDPTDLPTLLTGSPTQSADSLVVNEDGSVTLGSTVVEDGTVAVTGEISVSSNEAPGGTVAVLGESVVMVDATIDASGTEGGTVRIGGDYRGEGALPVAERIVVDSDTVVVADGVNGAGGSIVAFAENEATVQGRLSARGTTKGGLVETSADDLTTAGIEVDTSGETAGGEWLIDPVNVEVVSTAVGANQIEASAIAAHIDGGNTFTLETSGAGTGDGDIRLRTSINQTNAASTGGLTLRGRRFSDGGHTINLASSGELRFELNSVNPESNPTSSSIRSAVDAIGNVNGRRVVSLGAGNYGFTSEIVLDTDVDIEGVSPSSTVLSTLLAGTKVFRVNSGVSAAVRNVTLTTSGLATTDVGGGIRNNGTLTVDNSRFIDNRAHQNGGAIDSFNGDSVVITNSEFRHNRTAANGSGGAIHLGNMSGTSRISNTLFQSNSAALNGGGINTGNADLIVDSGSRFVENMATDGGGVALAVTGSASFDNVSFARNAASRTGGGATAFAGTTASFNNSTFDANRASEAGAGLSLYNGTYALTGSRVENNFAISSNPNSLIGAGIFARNSTLTLDDTAVRYNTAQGNGGGLFLFDGTTRILNGSVVSHNVAQENGGGVAIMGTGSLTVDSTFLGHNHADLEGGAIFDNTTATVSLLNGSVQTNTAGTNGGGLSLGGNGNVVLDTLGIKGNIAQGGDGGAIYLRDDGQVTIDSVNISDNQATMGVGGAIANTASNAQFTLSNASVNNNIATEGGAIYTSADSVSTMVSVAFVGNEATIGDGGAVYVDGNSGLTLDRAGFERNEAGDQGGAIYYDSTGALTIQNANFQANTANSDGGAIANYASDNVLTLRDVDFFNNISQEDGGAVFGHRDTTTRVEDSQFIGNRAEGATSNGGAIATLSGATVTLTDTTVQNNFAQRLGGGLHVEGSGRATVTGTLATDTAGVATAATTRFSNNTSGDDGGGISLTDTAQLAVSGALFQGNASGDDGGGVAVTYLSVGTFTNTNFENNIANDRGGGLYSNNVTSTVQTGNKVTVADSRFIGNEATNGSAGGFHQGPHSSAVVSNSLFRNNTAAVDGGGILVTFGSATIDNTQLVDNRASFGGGLELSSGAVVTVSNSAFTANQASRFGGGAQVDSGSTLRATGNTFEANTAPNGGGLMNRAIAEVTNTTFSGNQASGAGGAILSSDTSANLTLRNSTLSLNQANSGGGIAATASSLARLQNTIVAGNSATTAADVSGSFTDEGNNLIGQADGSTGFTNSFLVGSSAAPLDPRLAALADNGGPTKTHLLLADSAAVDTGGAANLPAVDQRGQARSTGIAADIGAVELTAAEAPLASFGEVLQASTGLLDPTLSTTAFSDLDLLLANRIDRDLESANASVRRLERFFSQSYEDYWDLSAGPDVSFDDVQGILRRAQEEYRVNSAVIYAVFAPETTEEDTSTLLRVDPTPADDDLLNLSVVLPEGELVSYQLPVTRQEAVRQARYFRSAVSDPEDSRSYQPLAQQLYQWLLAPIEEDLAAQNIHNLMYALDEGLRTVPITAMRDYHGFSLERYGISVVPSMGLMQADFPVSVRRATVAMGVSEFETEQPLPAVPIELDVVDQFVPVSHTVLNEETTLDALKGVQALEQPGVLHLATHASFDRRSPEESFIHMWDEPLSMSEFSQLGWETSDLELLILSACHTALGSRNAELGFAGLAAAAGVDATVGSLWEVSDVGTLALMSEFYAQLEDTDLRFEALRQAQLALLRGETRIENGNLITGHGEVDLPDEWNLPEAATLDHPFFWSSFTMVGNPW